MLAAVGRWLGPESRLPVAHFQSGFFILDGFIKYFCDFFDFRSLGTVGFTEKPNAFHDFHDFWGHLAES